MKRMFQKQRLMESSSSGVGQGDELRVAGEEAAAEGQQRLRGRRGG